MHATLTMGVFVAAAITAVSLLVISAPYGRHGRAGWGPAVPAKTPAPVVRRIYDEFVKAMKHPTLVERYNGAGLEITPSASPEAFTGFIKAEIDRWAPVVKASGAKVDN